MRRPILLPVSLLLCALLAGCQGYILFAHRFLEQVKQSLDPTEISAWAAETMADPPPDGRIPKDKLPASVTTEWPDKHKQAWLAVCSTSHVIIAWGGGFGHWGLAVGETNSFLGNGNYFLHWTNDIYVWHEIQR